MVSIFRVEYAEQNASVKSGTKLVLFDNEYGGDMFLRNVG
jgi:hypothetical protein